MPQPPAPVAAVLVACLGLAGCGGADAVLDRLATDRPSPVRAELDRAAAKAACGAGATPVEGPAVERAANAPRTRSLSVPQGPVKARCGARPAM